MNFGVSAQSVGAMAGKIMEFEVKDDADLARLCMLMRDFAQACGNVIDMGGDNIYTALFLYDRNRKGFGRTRAARVTQPIRHFAAGMRFSHRFMMRAVLLYRKLFAEDINNQNAGRKKQAFRPGGQSAA